MELRLLTTFLKVAQLQSFSKAAESLGYSQSAVTVQVQQLENELGVRLFDRIGKTVSITHYGQEFIPYARDVVSAAARAVSFTVEERDLTGTLRIGTIESIMTASFGEILPLYHERCPHVNHAADRERHKDALGYAHAQLGRPDLYARRHGLRRAAHQAL